MLKSNVKLAIKKKDLQRQPTSQLNKESYNKLVLAGGISSAKAESKPKLLKYTF